MQNGHQSEDQQAHARRASPALAAARPPHPPLPHTAAAAAAVPRPCRAEHEQNGPLVLLRILLWVTQAGSSPRPPGNVIRRRRGRPRLGKPLRPLRRQGGGIQVPNVLNVPPLYRGAVSLLLNLPAEEGREGRVARRAGWTGAERGGCLVCAPLQYLLPSSSVPTASRRLRARLRRPVSLLSTPLEAMGDGSKQVNQSRQWLAA